MAFVMERDAMCQSGASLGIYHRPASFSDRWLEYCQNNNVPYRLVNPFDSGVMDVAKDLKAFLWHWTHTDFLSTMVARHILTAFELIGIKVFPDTRTCWHFDDKVAQKYALEAINAPLAPTWVFYSLENARSWIEKAEFPKVFKLRRGAGSTNVRLVRSREEAFALCRKAFGRGSSPAPRIFGDWATKIRKTREERSFIAKLRRFPRSVVQARMHRRIVPPERGYVYFQEFMEGNEHDTRVIVVGKRAFALNRRNRPGDFRASGSGLLDRRPASIDLRKVETAFKVVEKLGGQSMGFDMVSDRKGEPVILEMSYGYPLSFCHGWQGHWDDRLNWHAGDMWIQDAILEDVLQSLS